MKALDYPVPVAGALDDDLAVRIDRLDQRGDHREIIVRLVLKMNLDLLINNTEVEVPCAEINSAVKQLRRSPFLEEIFATCQRVIIKSPARPPLLIIDGLQRSARSKFHIVPRVPLARPVMPGVRSHVK